MLNIPFLAYQLALLRRHGVGRAVLSCSYLVDEVRRTMGDGAGWGVKLDYAVEEQPLGTAGTFWATPWATPGPASWSCSTVMS